jgi:iron complex outermembrane receptor protein
MSSALGAVGLWLLSAVSLAQDPAPAPPAGEEPEAPAAEAPAAPAEAPGAPAEGEPAPAEPPAAEAPAGAAPTEDELMAAQAEDPNASAAEVASGELDEVVVTVDRRKKDLQDYSGVAASFSENKLSAVGITNAREISSLVPGLQIGTQEGNTEIYIRGVGSDNNTELGDPAVALHIDGVYIPRPRGVGSMFFDIERVEVNSGPQGTLRGRNAMGGSVNIVSARPKLGEFGANGEATFGTFAQRRYQGMVNIPVGDMLAFRFAGFSEVHDSYFVNAGPLYDITAGENADAYALRAQMLYQPAPWFSALFGYDLTKERGTGYLGANFQGPLTATETAGAYISNLTGMPSDPFNPAAVPFDIADVENPRRVFYRGMNPATDLMHEGYRAELTLDTGPLTLQALASYRRLKYEQVTGAHAGAVTDNYGFATAQTDVFTNGFWDSRSQSFIAELRAFAPDDSRLRWSAGGFYFDEDQQVFLGQVSDPAQGFGGGEFNMPNVKGGSVAGYVDATFDVVESFRVLGGFRVTYEDKSRNGGLFSLLRAFPAIAVPEGAPAIPVRNGTDGYRPVGLDRTEYEWPRDADGNYIDTVENRVNLYLSGIESFGARDTTAQALCNDPMATAPGEVPGPRVVPNPNGSGFRCANGVREGQGVSPGLFEAIPQNNAVDNLFYDWRAGVEFDATKDNLLYLTATTGSKSGGFNDTLPGAMPGEYANTIYRPEHVLAFELGSKNVLFDRDLRLNGSAFVYRYVDLVFQTIAGVEGGEEATAMAGDGGNTAQRQNAPTATPIYGLDLDIIYRLPAGLEAEVHVLLMQAKFEDGTIARDTRISDTASENYQVDLGGNWLPRVSPYTINFSLSQLIFSEVGSFNWVVQGQTRAQHYMTVFNGEGDFMEPAPGEMPDVNTPAYRALRINSQRLTDVVPTYTRFDLGAGWKHPDGRISINGFVNNVTNLAYSTSIISTPGLNLRFFNPPRTAGVRFRVDW